MTPLFSKSPEVYSVFMVLFGLFWRVMNFVDRRVVCVCSLQHMGFEQHEGNVNNVRLFISG